MKKAEAERGIRHMVSLWKKLPERAGQSNDELSFCAFYAWVRSEYPNYLDFRTTTGVSYDAEMWFDQELGTAWKK
ncbi:hypothetical protein [Sphingopyxis sp. NJF-3]